MDYRLPGVAASLLTLMAAHHDQGMAARWRRSQLNTSRADSGGPIHTGRPEVAGTPARCPACRSQHLKTTSKVVSAETYWRCCDCGEVWNADRHRTASRYR